jgi:hypothetical protein
MNNSKWTIVAGGALILVAQLPDIANIGALTVVATAFSLTYTTITVALSGAQGGLASRRAELSSLRGCPGQLGSLEMAAGLA